MPQVCTSRIAGFAHSDESEYRDYWAVHTGVAATDDAFFTGVVYDDLNGNEGAESTLAFHRAQTMIDAAALPVRLRIVPKPDAVSTS